LDRFTGMAVFGKVVEGSGFAAAARHFGMSPVFLSATCDVSERIAKIRP
jgi:hypothetical protein